jgi:hypothetical protein
MPYWWLSKGVDPLPVCSAQRYIGLGDADGLEQESSLLVVFLEDAVTPTMFSSLSAESLQIAWSWGRVTAEQVLASDDANESYRLRNAMVMALARCADSPELCACFAGRFCVPCHDRGGLNAVRFRIEPSAHRCRRGDCAISSRFGGLCSAGGG